MHLVRDLQVERGLTRATAEGAVEVLGGGVDVARAVTDASLAAGRVELERLRGSLPAAFRDVTEASFAAVETRLPGLRSRADQGGESPVGLFDEYTALVVRVLEIPDALAHTTEDANVVWRANVQQHLLAAIEIAGTERATVAAELAGAETSTRRQNAKRSQRLRPLRVRSWTGSSGTQIRSW